MVDGVVSEMLTYEYEAMMMDGGTFCCYPNLILLQTDGCADLHICINPSDKVYLQDFLAFCLDLRRNNFEDLWY